MSGADRNVICDEIPYKFTVAFPRHSRSIVNPHFALTVTSAIYVCKRGLNRSKQVETGKLFRSNYAYDSDF